jgi:hypothetical protein
MAKKALRKSVDVKSVDVIGFLAALIYTQSVLTVAHHTSMWVHDGSTYIVESPSIPALIIGLTVIAYSIFKNKMSVSTLNIISITVFAVASLFWLSGLRTNFYF